MSVSREPTVAELLRGLDTPTGHVAAGKHERMEAKLREARHLLTDILIAYANCFDPDAPPRSHEHLGHALENGRQHIIACGFREVPSEPFV